MFIYLYAGEQVKKAFTAAPFVSFRSGYSLTNPLVKVKVYPLSREKGSSSCSKSRCETCFNIQETDTLQIFVTKELFKINRHFHCDIKCIIYLISCKLYRLQYAGWRVDRFCLRWNNYKCSQKIASEGGTPNQSYYYQHLLGKNHSGLVKDCEIRLIQKSESFDPTRRNFFFDAKI